MVEKELTKFASYDNVRSILSKYMIGSYDQALVEKLLVILASEFRHNIERLSSHLPDDEVEAAAVISKKANNKRRGRPRKNPLDIEVVEDYDLLNED
jgi:hypothetical protein